MQETKYDMILVGTWRFENLIRAESKLDVLKKAYENMDIYGVEKALEAVFGVEYKYKGDIHE